jgi:hypothetical protein
MKLLFDSLDAFLAEVRDRKVEIVRISPALAIDTGRRTAGIPTLVSRVLVTAELNEHHWAEWRHWVGRAIAEVGDRGLHLPAWLREKQEQSVRAGLDSSRVTARARPGRDRHPFRNSARRRPREAQTSRRATRCPPAGR